MKKIFITGASRGIGLAIARVFYQAGFQTIICSRNAQKLAAAKAEMPDLHTFVCDISNKNAVKALAERINSEFGALDILVNNGGIFEAGGIVSGDETVYEKLLQTNVNSTFYFTQKLAPLMVEKKQGTIVNMCSIASFKPSATGGLYNVSKYALLGLSQALREELRPHNIRVINVLPSATKTDSWDGVDIPEHRFMPAEDIAQAVFDACHLSERTVIEEMILRPILGDI